MDFRTFGAALLEYRKLHDMSQQDLADILGTTKQVISRYETGQREPKISVAKQYSEKLNLPLSFFLGDNSPNTDSNSNSYLGMQIRNLRKQDNITQSDLANALGVGKSAVSMWENGQRDPDFETLESIADYFNVPISTFFPGSDASSSDISSYTLSSFERQVLKQLRLLTHDQQQAFLAFLTTLLDNQSP